MKKKTAGNIIVIVIISLLLGLLINLSIINHKVHQENPTAIFVKPLPRVITEVAIAEEGDMVEVRFDPAGEEKPRIKISWGDNKSFYLRIFKNDRHIDNIQKASHCILTIGNYKIEVVNRVSNEVVSSVFIDSRYMKDSGLFSKPVTICKK